MAKNLLTLRLSKNNIIAAVKADTYITGMSDKAVDPEKNAASAYNEQAGDDDYHEVKLFRTLRESLSKFEAQMSDFVDVSRSNAIITDTLSVDADKFTITLTVGSRFNRAFENALAQLAESYIINTMLYTWWQAIRPDRSTQYLGYANDSLGNVQRCLSKSAPNVSSSSYFTPTGTVVDDPNDPDSQGDNPNENETGTPPTINAGASIGVTAGQTISIYYTLGSEGIDDLECEVTSSNPTGAITVRKNASARCFIITGVKGGLATIDITSYRYPTINKTILVTIAAAVVMPPSITAEASYTLTAGDTPATISYTPASNGDDDLVIEAVQDYSLQYVLVGKNSSAHTFTIMGVNATSGAVIVNITSAKYPAINTTIAVTVNAQEQPVTPASLIRYADGDSINAVVGTPISIGFIPGRYAMDVVEASLGSEDILSLDVHENYVIVTPLDEGETTIQFSDADDFSASLSVLVAAAENVEPTPVVVNPTLRYVVGELNSQTNPMQTMGGDSLDIPTYKNIMVSISGGSGATLSIDLPAVSKATVSDMGDGIYVIHPISGSDSVVFHYGSGWSKTINVEYTPEVTVQITNETGIRTITEGQTNNIEATGGTITSCVSSNQNVITVRQLTDASYEVYGVAAGSAYVTIVTSDGQNHRVEYLVEAASQPVQPTIPEYTSGDTLPAILYLNDTSNGFQHPVFYVDQYKYVGLAVLSNSTSYFFEWINNTAVSEVFGSSAELVLADIVSILNSSYGGGFTAESSVKKIWTTSEDIAQRIAGYIERPAGSDTSVEPTLSWSSGLFTTDGTNLASRPTLSNPLGLTIQYSTDDPGVATIDSAGVLTLVGQGSCHVRATAAAQTIGNVSYRAKTVQYDLNVTSTGGGGGNSSSSPVDPDIAWSAGAFNTDGTNLALKPTLTNNSGVGITYSSTNTSVATIDPSTGVLTIVGDGTTLIKATSAANAQYNSKVVFYELRVHIPSATPTIDSQGLSRTIAVNGTNKITITDGMITDVILSNNNVSYEKYGNEATITGVTIGTCDVTIVCGDDNHTQFTVRYTVTGAVPNIGWTVGSVSTSSAGLLSNPPILSNPNNVPVTYSSGNTSVATVDPSTGAITVVGNGTCLITATSQATGQYRSQTASFTLNVSNVEAEPDPANPEIAWSNDRWYVQTPNSSSGAPTLANPNSVGITYSSSDTSVASIDASTGAITLNGVGVCTITATSTAGNGYASQAVSYELCNWPIANFSGGGSTGVGESNLYTIGVGMSATLTVDRGTVTDYYTDGNNGAIAVTKNGNVLTITALAEQQTPITVYIEMQENIGGGNGNLLTPRVNTIAPTVEYPYRAINDDKTDTFAVENGTVTSVSATPSGIVSVSNNYNNITVQGVSGSASGSQVTVNVACNNGNFNLPVMYKVYPAASAVTLPSGVTRETPIDRQTEFVNYCDNANFRRDTTWLSLCASFESTDVGNNTNHVIHPVVRVTYDASQGKHVVCPVVKQYGVSDYRYYVREYSSMNITATREDSTLSTLIANMAKAALSQYGFDVNKLVIGSVVYLGYQDTPWVREYIEIP